jgi:hypothetical protein
MTSPVREHLSKHKHELVNNASQEDTLSRRGGEILILTPGCFILT